MNKRMNLSRSGILALAPLAAALGGAPLTGCSDKVGPSYVYALANPDGANGVEAFRRDRNTGQLTRIGRFSTGGQGFEAIAGFGSNALVSDGRYVFAVNPGSNSVSSLRIEQDGSLTPIGQPADVTTPYPVTLTVNRNLLYVGSSGYSPGTAGQAIQAGGYQGFRVENDGRLTPLACPVAPTATNSNGGFTSGMVLNQDNTLFVGTVLLGDTVHIYNVDGNGCLVNPKTMSGGGGPFSVIYRPGEPRELYMTIALPQVYLNSQAPGVASFNVDPNTGTLTQRSVYTDPDKSDTALRDPCWVLFAPDGRRFWTSSFIPRSINLFEIENGQIRRLSEYQPNDSVPDPTDPNQRVFVASEDVAIDTAGRFLYQLRSAAANPLFGRPVRPSIAVLESTGSTGSNAGLREVQRLDLPEDLTSQAGATGIVVVDR
jgi:6-phosphogluconolactonase